MGCTSAPSPFAVWTPNQNAGELPGILGDSGTTIVALRLVTAIAIAVAVFGVGSLKEAAGKCMGSLTDLRRLCLENCVGQPAPGRVSRLSESGAYQRKD